VIVFAAFAQIGLALGGKLPAGMAGYGLGLGALVAIAFVITARFAPYADPLLLPLVTLLNGIGLAMIYRLDVGSQSTVKASTPNQLMWTALGVAFFTAVVLLLRDLRMLQRLTYTLGALGLFMLIMPVLPVVGREINGSRIWIFIGPFSIQPGEFAKILLLIFFAAFLVSKRDLFMAAGRRVLGIDLPRARDLGPILVAWAVSVGVLIFEKDLGTSLLFFGVLLVMLYVATERVIWVIMGGTLFVGGCLAAYYAFDHVRLRVQNWLDPFADYTGGGYQIAQSLFGFGTGGMGGTGLGAGRPDMVPLANSDFITAAIGEELGLIGLAAMLLVYMLLAMRGMRSAVAVRDTFGKLLGGGLSFTLIMQVFVVVGGVTKLIPMTGITSPFLSAGGSSLLANYVLVALLLRISDAARRPHGGTRPRLVAQAPLAEAHTVMVERPS
jgi:cell division protein FtsW (lipid II flippase)